MSKKRTKEPISQEYLRLGAILAELRNASGWSQAEAASKIGIPQSTYSGYETGSRKVSLKMLDRIATVYNVGVDYLIGNAVESRNSSTDEDLLLKLYRLADEDTKKMVLKLLTISTK